MKTKLFAFIGESFSHEDIEDAFKELLAEQPRYNGKLPRRFSAKEFIGDILGLSTDSPAEEGTENAV